MVGSPSSMDSRYTSIWNNWFIGFIILVFALKFYCNFILHMHSVAYSTVAQHYITTVVVLQTVEEIIQRRRRRHPTLIWSLHLVSAGLVKQKGNCIKAFFFYHSTDVFFLFGRLLSCSAMLDTVGFNYTFKETNTTLRDKVCQWLVTGRWFSLGASDSSTNKTDRYDITEILLKMALNTITLTLTNFSAQSPNNETYIVLVVIVTGVRIAVRSRRISNTESSRSRVHCYSLKISNTTIIFL